MESCSKTRMILMSVVILGICSIDIVSSVLDDHTEVNLNTTKVPEENNQIDIDLKNNEIPSSGDAAAIVEHHESSDSGVSIVNLPEEDSQDVVTVLEDNIRSSVKDEIQLVQNFESSAIDVIEDIPDPEVRQTLTEDLMAIEYPQSVKKSDDSEIASTTAASIKQDNASLTELPVEITTAPTTVREVTVEGLTSVAPSDIESTTTNSPLTEETTIIATKVVENINILENMEDPNEINQIQTRQMRGFDEDEESAVLNHSFDSSDNSSSSHSFGLPVKDLLQSESSTKDENVGAEETSEELDEVISQDASVEGGFQKESINMRQILLPRISPTRRPYIATTTEAPITMTTEITASPILIEQITESTVAEWNDVAVTTGVGNHIVIKKPGVDEEYSLLETTDNIMLTNTNAPLDVEISSSKIPTETTTHNDEEEEVDVASNSTEMPALHTKDFSFAHKTEHDNFIVDEDLQQNNERLYTESSPDEHNKQLIDGSSNIASEVFELTKDPISYVSNSTAHIKPTLRAPEHADHKKIIEQSDAVAEKQEGIEIAYAPTLSADFKQQLTNVLPTNSQESIHEVTNQMHFSGPISQNNLETSTERPTSHENENLHYAHLDDGSADSSGNAIFRQFDEALPFPTPVKEHSLESITFETSSENPLTPSNTDRTIKFETSTEKPSGRSNEDETTPALVYTLIEAAELTTEFARHVDSFRAARDEATAISDEIISTAAAGRSFNAIVAEGLGKPLPTRSVGDEPSSSSYSSEDKTTTVVVLCSSAAIIFIAFSVAMYLITFQRQHGTLDIEMQEQQCGKDDLEEDEDAETRVTLLHQLPQADSDTHSFE